MFVLSTDLVKESGHAIHTDCKNFPSDTQTLLYVFDWSVLRGTSYGKPTKLIMRVYKDQSLNSTMVECSKATLQAKVFHKHTAACIGEEMIEVTDIKTAVNMSNGRSWEQLNLTESLKYLWPIKEGCYEVYVNIVLKSQCEDKSLSIKLLDLKSMTKLKLRRKLYAKQPVLSLYINSTRLPSKPIQSVLNAEKFKVSLDGHSSIQKRRNTGPGEKNDKCRRVDHTVSFKELRINYVIAPSHFNAGRCVGYCDSLHLHDLAVRGELQKVNNYARLLATQAYRRKDKDLMICCSPGEYKPVMLLIQSADGSSVKQKIFDEMIVSDCYCR